MILAATLLYAMLVTLVNLGVDFTYGLLDPRIRAEIGGRDLSMARSAQLKHADPGGISS